MIGFLTGIVCAAALSVVMLVGMETFFVPTEQVYAGPNLNLSDHMIEDTVGPEESGD